MTNETSTEAIEGEESRRLPLAQLSLLALGLGVLTGLGAVLFRFLIGFIHNLLFAGRALVHYDANVFTAPSPWGALVILVPVLGAVAVTFLVNNFAPEAKGHGVPEVMDAIYYKGGIIRPVVALVKSLASAIAIGSGSSVAAYAPGAPPRRRPRRPPRRGDGHSRSRHGGPRLGTVWRSNCTGRAPGLGSPMPQR